MSQPTPIQSAPSLALFAPAKKPVSALGYHRILSPTAGVRVSPLCLGTMNFGDAWKDYLGECSKETVFEMLDFFYENGGNFLDTANNYQGEESETLIGEWMDKRNNREEMVIATKFTTGYRTRFSKDVHENIMSNFQGNHAKSAKLSVEASLKKLRTDYIDLLYVHWWDMTTSVPELMNALHALVQNGKVLYLGISDTPAWVVVKCNDYARFHGLTQFSVYQGYWSCAFRDFEREIIPMTQAEGMALAPWGSLGRGQFKLPEEYNDPNRDGRKAGAQSEKIQKVVVKLSELAKKKDTQITSIALAYVMHKAPYVFPIIGGRKVSHLKENIEALRVELTPEEINSIDDAEPFDAGFPNGFLFGGKPWRTENSYSDIDLVNTNAPLEAVPRQKPIPPKFGETHIGPGLSD